MLLRTTSLETRDLLLRRILDGSKHLSFVRAHSSRASSSPSMALSWITWQTIFVSRRDTGHGTWDTVHGSSQAQLHVCILAGSDVRHWVQTKDDTGVTAGCVWGGEGTMSEATWKRRDDGRSEQSAHRAHLHPVPPPALTPRSPAHILSPALLTPAWGPPAPPCLPRPQSWPHRALAGLPCTPVPEPSQGSQHRSE